MTIVKRKRVTYTYVPPGVGMSNLSEFINDLDTLPMNTISRTQADAISAIRSGHFLVGSIAANGDFSVSASPVVHTNAISARSESKRLAASSPGKAFVILKLNGAELVPNNIVSI